MRKIILTFVAALICAATFAQGNLNPTVEVTNTYQGDPSAVHKPQIGMAIPDSLLRFDMDFGYEVFEKPYQGAYNFKPYMLAMKPEKNAYRGRKLYLKAGAGYSLHPQLDFVFSPEQSGPFQMSVYAGHRSYFGKYNTLTAAPIDGTREIIRVPQSSFSGYDMLNSLGFEGSYSLPKAIVTFGVGYEGIVAQDTLHGRSFNAADFNVRIRSNRDDEKYIYYDVAMNGRFAGDHVVETLGESIFNLNGNVGPVLGGGNAVLVGFEAETASYSRLFETNAGRLALIPKYHLTMGKLDASVGVRAEVLVRPKTSDGSSHYPSMYQTKGGVIFPDVHISYGALENLLLYVSATGGNKVNTFSSIISRHHFINPDMRYATLLDNSIEKVNGRIGLKAKSGSNLQVEVDGGFAFVGNGLLDSGYPVYSLADGTAGGVDIISYLPGVAYSDYSLLYADAMMDLKAGNFRIDGGVHIRKMALKYEEVDFGLMLPRVSADFKAVYDFNSRVYAGVRAQVSSGRRGYCGVLMDGTEPLDNAFRQKVKIPGWFDLGLLGGWQFNRKLGFWLESGNLLCETIQRSPFYSEKDLWITAGITLNL
ncbi:MAG: hypothetical protein IKW99_10595 [Bacteroidales bacterium]|nr:hypothetical protein [Bacteroidales bacterium]